MHPTFVQITTGTYSYVKRVEYSKEIMTGHSVYGLDENGQIWKFTCKNNDWKWAKIEECMPIIENFE